MKPLNLAKKQVLRVIVVLMVASTDITWLTAMQRTLKEAYLQLMASMSSHRTPHSRKIFNKTCQLTGTVCGLARRPHFSMAVISVTEEWCLLGCYAVWLL
jgi:hypothetical protein